jgi:hypothetical protein
MNRRNKGRIDDFLFKLHQYSRLEAVSCVMLELVTWQHRSQAKSLW